MRSIICEKIGPGATSSSLRLIKTADDRVKKLELPPGTLKLKALACGLSLVDLLQCEGKHVFTRQAPYVPGLDVCGKVIEVNNHDGSRKSNDLKVGDLVFGMVDGGGLSDYCLMRTDAAYRINSRDYAGTSLPKVSPLIFSGFEMNYGTTYHGLVDLANANSSDIVLILGASGGVGMAAVDLAKNALHCTVIACCSSEKKCEAIKKAYPNVDQFIVYGSVSAKFGSKEEKKQIGENLKLKLKKSGYYGKVSIVYDPVGGELAMPSLTSLCFGGRYLVIGFASGGLNPTSGIPRVPLNQVLLNERKILGCLWGGWKLSDQNVGNRRNMEKMIQWVEEGRLKPYISHLYTMEEYSKAFATLRNREVVGKICIRMEKDSKL